MKKSFSNYIGIGCGSLVFIFVMWLMITIIWGGSDSPTPRAGGYESSHTCGYCKKTFKGDGYSHSINGGCDKIPNGYNCSPKCCAEGWRNR